MMQRKSIVFIALALVCSWPGCSDKATDEPDAVQTRTALTLEPEPVALEQDASTRAVEPRFIPFEELAKVVEPLSRDADTTSAPEADSKATPVPEPETPVQAVDGAEPNQTPDTAQVVPFPALISGKMDPVDKKQKEGDVDWYAFDVRRATPGILVVSLSGLNKADLGLEVSKDGLKGREVLISINNAPASKGETIPNICLNNGRYYVSVWQKLGKRKAPFSSTEATYELRLSAQNLTPDRECEPNGDPLLARSLTLPAKISGTLNRYEDEDLYHLDLTRLSRTNYLAIELLPPKGANMTVSLRTRTQDEIFSVTSSGGNALRIPNLGIMQGYSEYFLSLKGTEKNQHLGDYSLTVSAESLQERMELEPNASPELALRVPYDQPMKGWIVSDKDIDLFRVEAPGDMPPPTEGSNLPKPAVHIEVAAVPGVDLVVDILDADSLEVLEHFDQTGKGKAESIPNMAVPLEPVVLRITSAGGANSREPYVINMTLVPTDGYEIEPNNSPEIAAELPDGEVRGYLASSGDRDCFRIQPARPALVIRSPDGAGLEVQRVLASGETQVAQMEPAKSATLPSEQEAYVLCVTNAQGTSRPSQNPYVLGEAVEAP